MGANRQHIYVVFCVEAAKATSSCNAFVTRNARMTDNVLLGCPTVSAVGNSCLGYGRILQRFCHVKTARVLTYKNSVWHGAAPRVSSCSLHLQPYRMRG